MEIEEKFLPIGTVVLLKGGKRELMITGYCISPSGEVYDKSGKVDIEEGQMFDYGACYYPEGVLVSDQMFAFNHDQISRICFKGYETEDQQALSEILNGGLEMMEQEKATDEIPEEQPVIPVEEEVSEEQPVISVEDEGQE